MQWKAPRVCVSGELLRLSRCCFCALEYVWSCDRVIACCCWPCLLRRAMMSSTLCCYMPRFIQANPIQYCCISSSSSSRSMHRFIGPLALTNSVLTATMLLLRRAPMLAGTVLVLRNAYSLNTASISTKAPSAAAIATCCFCTPTNPLLSLPA